MSAAQVKDAPKPPTLRIDAGTRTELSLVCAELQAAQNDWEAAQGELGAQVNQLLELNDRAVDLALKELIAVRSAAMWRVLQRIEATQGAGA